MGEGTPDVRQVETPEQLGQEVENIRGEMNGLVRELDRRRHELLDWRLQLRKNALPLGIGAIGFVCVIGGWALFKARQKRRKSGRFAKIELFSDALSRMIAHPERVARPQPSLGKAVLSGTATALLGAAAKAIAARTF